MCCLLNTKFEADTNGIVHNEKPAPNVISLKASILPSKLIIHNQSYSNSAPKQARFTGETLYR